MVTGKQSNKTNNGFGNRQFFHVIFLLHRIYYRLVKIAAFLNARGHRKFFSSFSLVLLIPKPAALSAILLTGGVFQ
jgi:hypothetical protein